MATLLDYAGAADFLDLPETWLRRNIRRIPHEKYGKYVRFGPEHLEAIRAMHAVIPAIRPRRGSADLVPRGAR
ncbi:hypothetical protein ACFC1T_02110 [Kitasatospora sp. NPDC056076]|uniref:hypothetical protein n=1 Tax=Kitasatospora sp. NPDC056076 TaxID=3345703 RepID=UPI0035D93E5C